MSQENSDVGNTKEQRLRTWFFTYNNPTISWSQLSQLVNVGEIIKFVGQLERGENGTPHYQGLVQFKHQIKFKTLKSCDTSIHWEPCRNLKAALEYVTKADTRIEGPWSMGWDIPEQIRVSEPSDTFPWQVKLRDELLEPSDDRRVHWIFEYNGSVGKTAFCKFMAIRHGALVLGGKAADIKCGVARWVREHGKLGIGLFHFTRSVEGYISYEAIEAIKDGIFYSGKYESGMVVYNSPHVVCFANFPPDFSKLSEDRWLVREIKGLDF